MNIQAQATTQDALGQRDETWTTVATVWGAVKPVSGREFFAASGERAEITHEITVRHGVTVGPEHRVLFGSRVFDIRSVINLEERNRMLVLMAVENAA